ncbi:class III lanthionine synthetase LanKC [Actinoalloteichus sp. GBA129-24]|uniref:class III lanthionine synthetase LanKC n=1 Tax=Actinoalloteichus sp. GBA129-24 TaxID=1612551 RepID=UPI0009509224|nr:class III lanthionine synthetase LanKC [Actinoalloteichus sp. GBA129-24]APU20664.1 phosphotransferase family protein [Actinoalloteichus sp. GBA129-24]
MTARYEAYCFADPVFYDSSTAVGVESDAFEVGLPVLPPGWRRHDREDWAVCLNMSGALPRQGWKIHVSAGLSNAGRVLDAVWRYCTSQGVSFKFLRTRRILLARNSKYAERAGSGKLITIYPPDEVALRRILVDLDRRLDGAEGPYILSDLRFASGPLYLRYGGFVDQWMIDESGNRVSAVTRPDGTLVPDRREPRFVLPDWVTLPDFLQPHLAARRGGPPADFDYRIHSALHFSNGGGVYLADRLGDGVEVVLKEARPLAGLDRDGTDAVTRLDREWTALRALAGLPGVPEAYECFPLWEHRFLAMERRPGIPLGRWLAVHYPLTRQDPARDELIAFRDRAMAILAAVERLVDGVHERGLVFGDLHDRNILIDADDSVSLIDFELTLPVEQARRPALGAPGFTAPADRVGFEIDHYALAALRLWMFLPLNAMLALAPDRLTAHLAFATERFDLPASYGDRLAATLRGRGSAVDSPAPRTVLDDATPDPVAARDSLLRAVLASATPDRADRLFPGDVEQFSVGGACFAHGAAGVLYALDVAGAERRVEHERWLIEAVRREPPPRAGFYDGAHGIAHVLDRLGHRETADELIDGAASLVPRITDHGLRGGLAGIGLNHLHLAATRRVPDHHATAVEIGTRLVDALALAPAPDPEGRARAGLLYGWSGPALLFLRLYQRTGDPAWLTAADRAVGRDLSECVAVPDGATQVRDGSTRTLPYLDVGSAGIAVVVNALAAQHPEADSASALPDLLHACLGDFVIHPGLLLGRAGLMGTLALAARRRADPRIEAGIRRHRDLFALHAVPYQGELAFPGHHLLRLSMDLATGGAGVLLAMTCVLDPIAPLLPFLDEVARPPT